MTKKAAFHKSNVSDNTAQPGSTPDVETPADLDAAIAEHHPEAHSGAHSQAGSHQPTPEMANQPDVQKYVQQIVDLTNDLQRTRADFENFRRRAEERQEATKKSANLATVFKFLPLLDDLGRAFDNYAELEPLKKSFDKTLKDLGLTLIETAPGTEFNPDFHEAVLVEGDGAKEVIAETLRPGYLYNGALLRAAMVKVKRVE